MLLRSSGLVTQRGSTRITGQPRTTVTSLTRLTGDNRLI